MAGVRQVLRALEAGTVDTVFLAADAEPKLQARVREACGRCGAAVIEAESMHALGQACGLGVGAACAALRRRRRGAETVDNHPYRWVAGSLYDIYKI